MEVVYEPENIQFIYSTEITNTWKTKKAITVSPSV